MELNNTRIKWTEEMVIEKIQELHLAGEPLNASHIMKTNSRLYGASRKHLGSWKAAVGRAGIDYATINLRSNETSWTQEMIVEEIKSIYAKGEPLNSDYIQKNHTKLHSASQRYFNSWGEAVETAGLNYNDIKGIKWTEETVSQNIIELEREGVNLSSSNMQKNHMSLFQAGCRIYGSWKDAVNNSGVDYNKFRKQREWTVDIVNEEIKKFYLEHGAAPAGLVSRKYGSLYQVARRMKVYKNKNWDEIVQIALES